ncbi:GNAT family acetyltransferase [Spongiibacter taiwanensis]|uniref:GNAT family acetyltransferase n=1 Tax=Spongiibacter taiwanensis TaxID=1748242 RepID=UPI002035B9FE|nr:GNAT family acetyltransferase [Spongiibacter taiwanensis]USA41771.1 GNAT family acetyltransferase [Spongiibacter taiwanensis]
MHIDDIPLASQGTRISLTAVHGDGLLPYLDDLAALRIAVFREWPYLYEGNLGYEANYLGRYAACSDSLTLLCHHGPKLIGASTALPMVNAEEDMQAPLLRAAIPLDRVLYYGESLILPSYRGFGLGRQFFQYREQHAQQLAVDIACFCAVERPDAHPGRPPHYRGNDAFWLRQGYLPTSMICQFDWPDIGENATSTKPLRFWIKPL